MRLTIYGCGALGARVAQRWKGSLTIVTRSDARLDELNARFPHADVTCEDVVQGTLLIAVPASAQQALLARLPPIEGPAVLVSTTSVYRPYRGTLTPDSPYGTTDRARSNAQTEQRFLQKAAQGRLVRLGGLFSAERGPAAAFARRGTARTGPPNATLPLIHYDDAATLVLEALHGGPRVRLGVTHQPSRQTYYGYWAAELGLEEPAYTEPVDEPAVFEGTAVEAPVHWRLKGPASATTRTHPRPS